MNGGRSIAEANEKEREGQLLQEGKRRNNLEDAPAHEFLIANVVYTQACLRRWIVDVEIFSEPLFDDETERGCCKAQD